ncbi:translation initiation factor IF-3 [soil metagenome]
MSNYEAQQLAQSKALDLVEISPNSSPPVCRIADYGKFKYEREKKEKLAKKTQVIMHVKEVRFNPNTDSHDVEFKSKHIRQFLIEGHKIKIVVMFRGRMITHPEIGRKLMEDVLEKVTDLGKIEAPPKMEGKQLIAYLMPDKAKIAAHLKAEKQLEKQQARPVSERSASSKAAEKESSNDTMENDKEKPVKNSDSNSKEGADSSDSAMKAAFEKAQKDKAATAPVVNEDHGEGEVKSSLNTDKKE